MSQDAESTLLPLFLYGAGGHASVVADVVQSSGIYRIAGLIDDDPQRLGCERFGYCVIGNGSALSLERTYHVFISIGDNQARSRIAISLPGRSFPTLIHPQAVIESEVSIGAGTVVMPGAVVEHGAVIGAHCIINNGAVIGHNCLVGDFCHVSGNSALGGGVTLYPFVFAGMGSVVTPGVSVGRNCLITAGSVVTRNIPRGATIIGNPGRPLFNRAG